MHHLSAKGLSEQEEVNVLQHRKKCVACGVQLCLSMHGRNVRGNVEVMVEGEGGWMVGGVMDGDGGGGSREMKGRAWETAKK